MNRSATASASTAARAAATASTKQRTKQLQNELIRPGATTAAAAADVASMLRQDIDAHDDGICGRGSVHRVFWLEDAGLCERASVPLSERVRVQWPYSGEAQDNTDPLIFADTDWRSRRQRS